MTNTWDILMKFYFLKEYFALPHPDNVYGNGNTKLERARIRENTLYSFMTCIVK